MNNTNVGNLLLMTTKETSVYVRDARFPYPVLLPSTKAAWKVRAALQADPSATLAVEPEGAFSLEWQEMNLRQDDKATNILFRIRPNLALQVLENIAMGEKVMPVFPAEGWLWLRCTCARGIVHPHDAWHSCLPPEDAITDASVASSILSAVPGISWRRVVNGELLPLLEGVLSVPEWATYEKQLSLGHPRW